MNDRHVKPDFDKRQSQIKEIWRRFKKNRSAMIGLVIIILLIIPTIFAAAIHPYEIAIKQDLTNRLLTPSSEHWFGTDSYGRDLLARCLHGARISLGIGLAGTLGSLLLGIVFGSAAAFFGGKYDNIIMRSMDVFNSIPSVLLALSIVAALGSSILNLIIAITLTRMASFVRIVRSSVLPIVDQEYIEAARAGGTSDIRIISRHILPNAVGPVMVQTTMSISMIILQVSSLSFLGLGVSAPTPEWGAIISEAREFLRLAPYMMFFPGILIILTALSFNLVGDGLRDSLDPRLKT